MTHAETKCGLAQGAIAIDHVAIAVHDLEASLPWYTQKLGFELVEQKVIRGAETGMILATLKAGPITFVLVQGTSPQSQVSQFLEKHGPGVHHVAISVENIDRVADSMTAAGGEFETAIVGGPALRQTFVKRDSSSGLMLEVLQRCTDGLCSTSAEQLFREMESHAAH
jgi:methylmalonyl-CoA epimerase